MERIEQYTEWIDGKPLDMEVWRHEGEARTCCNIRGKIWGFVGEVSAHDAYKQIQIAMPRTNNLSSLVASFTEAANGRPPRREMLTQRRIQEIFCGIAACLNIEVNGGVIGNVNAQWDIDSLEWALEAVMRGDLSAKDLALYNKSELLQRCVDGWLRSCSKVNRAKL